MSFEGSRAVLIKDLSGNIATILSGVVNVGQTVAFTSGYNGITQTATTVRTRISGYLPVTDASGGASLGSGLVIHGIRLRNLTSGQGNLISGVVWIGGSGTNLSPFSGHGYMVPQGEEIELKVQNFNQVRVCAQVSGCFVSTIGIDF